MAWIQVRLRMTLKDEGSSITVKGTRVMTNPIVTGNTTFPSEAVYVSLKPTKILLGLQRLLSWYPSWSNERR